MTKNRQRSAQAPERWARIQTCYEESTRVGGGRRRPLRVTSCDQVQARHMQCLSTSTHTRIWGQVLCKLRIVLFWRRQRKQSRNALLCAFQITIWALYKPDITGYNLYRVGRPGKTHFLLRCWRQRLTQVYVDDEGYFTVRVNALDQGVLFWIKSGSL